MHKLSVDLITAESEWFSTSASTRQYTFYSLLKGKNYWYIVGAVSINGQLVFTDPVMSKLVQ